MVTHTAQYANSYQSDNTVLVSIYCTLTFQRDSQQYIVKFTTITKGFVFQYTPFMVYIFQNVSIFNMSIIYKNYICTYKT